MCANAIIIILTVNICLTLGSCDSHPKRDKYLYREIDPNFVLFESYDKSQKIRILGVVNKNDSNHIQIMFNGSGEFSGISINNGNTIIYSDFAAPYWDTLSRPF
jgi:hypothetical protein